jgi:hypothetical protein
VTVQRKASVAQTLNIRYCSEVRREVCASERKLLINNAIE